MKPNILLYKVIYNNVMPRPEEAFFLRDTGPREKVSVVGGMVVLLVESLQLRSDPKLTED